MRLTGQSGPVIQAGYIVGPKRQQKPLKSASLIYASRSRWGIKAWKWDLFSMPHQKGISRVWGGKMGFSLELG